MSLRLTALVAALSLLGAAATTAHADTHRVDRTWSKTFSLRSERTKTYTLRLPASFKKATSPAAIGYALYPRTGPGFAVSRPIGRQDAKQPAYLGVTVMRTSFKGHRVTVTVKTGSLERPMALELSARGSA